MDTLLDLWHTKPISVACGGIIILSLILSCALMAGLYMVGIIGSSQTQALPAGMQPTLIALQTNVAVYAATHTPLPTYTLLPTYTPQTAKASIATVTSVVADLPTYTPISADTSIPEETRKQIFYDLMELQDQGAKEEVYSIVAERYGVAEQAVQDIMFEGLSRNWPMPTKIAQSPATAVPPTSASVPTNTPRPTSTPGPINTPRPTNTPKHFSTPLPPGMAYENPAPVGKPVATDNDFEITVLGVKHDAWQEIEQANMFNQPAREGSEYVLVRAQVKNLGPQDETHQVSSYEFRLTGSHGVVRSSASVVINSELDGEMFGGGVLEGQLVYEIPQDETNLTLIYDPGIAVSPRWLAVEEITKPIVRPIEPVTGAAERGLRKNAPAALGAAVLSDHGVEITVLEVDRSAWSMIHEMNPFNEKPADGKEYVLTRIRARHVEGREQTRHVNSTDFRVTGEKGVIYKRPSLVVENELDVELFRNGVFVGYLAFEVTEGEQELMLIYDPGLGSTARYLSLE